MRLLVANIPLPSNRFLVDLNDALAKRVALTHDEKMFWSMQGDFDVIHLHFPEYVTFEHEQQYVHGLSDDLIADYSSRVAAA
jgi:hypothetical protein